MKRKRIIWGILVLSMVPLFLVANALFPIPMEKSQAPSRLVLAENGQLLRAFANQQGVWQFKVENSQVSSLYLQALLGYEDEYFYYHPGFNPLALARAAVQNLMAGRIISGASTLTMQVARLLDPNSRTLAGKAKQLFRSIQLEFLFSKNEILDLYLQLAPFGGNIQGIKAASLAYFHKDPLELSHAEAALLAVLPQSPTKFRPDLHPEVAKSARDKVIKRLIQQGIWPKAILAEASQEPIYSYQPNFPMDAPLFSQRIVNENKLPAMNSSYHTSIDQQLQQGLSQRVKNFAHLLDGANTVALMLIDNEKWLVKAYLGTAKYSDRQSHGYIDMTQVIRSPGSTLKPFIYAQALDQSIIHSKSLLVDAPRIHSDYQPLNFSGHFHGPVSAQSALQQSLNVPAVQLLEKMTPDVFINKLMNVGIAPQWSGSEANLSMALGGLGVSMEDLMSLYGAIARQGVVSPLRFSETDPLVERRLMSPQAAWIIYAMLSDQERGDRLLNSQFSGIENHLAYKTGTSFGYRDAWAFGVTGKYSIGVWVGRPDGTPSPNQYGAATALPLLFEINDWLKDKSHPRKPNQISQSEICWPSGLKATLNSEAKCLIRHQALGIDDQFPATLSATANDPWQGATMSLNIAKDSGLRTSPYCEISEIPIKITLWPIPVEPWIDARWRSRALIPSLDPRCHQQNLKLEQPLSILSIQDQSHLRLLDTDQTLEIPLESQGGIGDVEWFLDGNKLPSIDSKTLLRLKRSTNKRQKTDLTLGQHELIAIDGLGAMDKVEFSVDNW